jgi:hypothetical protein
MILFPAMMVGGHLLLAVVDKVPDLNFTPICREGTGEIGGAKDDGQVCMDDERAARDELAQKWSQFGSEDRARCIRLSTNDHSASYVEVLTCLEMGLAAKKLHPATGIAIDAPESAPRGTRESSSPPDAGVQVARQPVSAPPPPPPPLPLAPRSSSASGFPQVLCLPGLKSIIAACNPSGGRP